MSGAYMLSFATGLDLKSSGQVSWCDRNLRQGRSNHNFSESAFDVSTAFSHTALHRGFWGDLSGKWQKGVAARASKKRAFSGKANQETKRAPHKKNKTRDDA